MAAAALQKLRRQFQSLAKNKFGILRCLSNIRSLPSTSKGKKLPNAAFLLGFGLAGFIGFSGIYEKKKLIKKAKASRVEGETDGVKNQNAVPKQNPNSSHGSSWTLQSAINESQSIIQCMKEECGIPGVSVAVSVDGETVWREGFGFADVENRVLCSSKTVMRIASISKPLTATAVAKLWEEGKLDLDAAIQTYATSFPIKTFNGSTTILTTRHLLSHLGGIRHYDKTQCNKESKINKNDENDKKNTPQEEVSISRDKDQEVDTSRSRSEEFSFEEYYIKDHYKTVSEALSLFKDDPLLSNPGTTYLYTTHGWTLLSAVIEKVADQDFLPFMKKLFKDLGMENTCAEFNDKIIYNRARFYQRNEEGHLVNAPYVDNSYKWAGGGFMSTAEDLVQFGNSMLYAKQMAHNKIAAGCLPGFLKPETVTELWKIAANTEGQGHKDGGYGLGWVVIPQKQDFGACHHQSEAILHGGGAVGASSVLLIRPTTCNEQPPKGVVVALLVNLQKVNLQRTAIAIAACFEKTQL